MTIPVVNSFDNWGRLEEVWLGDVYPADWYSDLSPEIHDAMARITEITREDLAVVQSHLEHMGVKVQRPRYQHKQDFMVPGAAGEMTLRKPEICPRDLYFTAGNRLFAHTPDQVNPWQHAIDSYQGQPDCEVAPRLRDSMLHINGASTVRAGRDIYFDLVWQINNPGRQITWQEKMQALVEHFKTKWQHMFADYRVHLLFNGGHVDGCFALLKPELILASSYFKDYDRTFPRWHRIECNQPEFMHDARARKTPAHNGRWYMPGVVDTDIFNQHVARYLLDWIGDYTETYFEVNCLVIDPQNVMVLGDHPSVRREIERRGINVHVMPFRARTFWDGGLHCLTVDIRRQSGMTDYFPNRGSNGIFVYTDTQDPVVPLFNK